MDSVSEKELEKMAASVTDEAFENFQHRIKHQPEQVSGCLLQGSHCTGKTGKIVKNNSRQGKYREFENFRMILKSNSHLHSRATGRDSQVTFDVLARLCYFIYKIHREKYKLHREKIGKTQGI